MISIKKLETTKHNHVQTNNIIKPAKSPSIDAVPMILVTMKKMMKNTNNMTRESNQKNKKKKKKRKKIVITKLYWKHQRVIVIRSGMEYIICHEEYQLNYKKLIY